jgi:hypothetical protein
MNNQLSKISLFIVTFILLSTLSFAQNCRHYSPFTDIIGKSTGEAQSIIKSNVLTTYFKYTGKSGSTYYFKPSYRTGHEPIIIECSTSSSGRINEVKITYESYKKADVIRGFTNRGWKHFTNTDRLVCETTERQLNYWTIGNEFTLRIQNYDPPKNNDGSLMSERVFICGGDYGYKFHSYNSCPGLNNCQGGITWYNTQRDAYNQGFRFCDICWND